VQPTADRPDKKGSPVTVLYVDGTARSGSTVLARMIGAQPKFVTIGEAVLIWRFGVVGNGTCSCGAPFSACPFWRDVGDSAPGLFDRRVAQLYTDFSNRVVLRSRQLPRLWTARGRERIAESIPPGFLDDLSRLYHAVRTVSGADVVVDSSKFAAYRFLLGLVPGLNVETIHLIRDPRAVAFSWQRKGLGSEQNADESVRFEKRTPFVAGLDWDLQNYSSDVISKLERNRSTRIRYEDFVEHPKEAIHELMRLVGDGVGCREPEDLVVDLPAVHIFGNPNRFQSGATPIRFDDQWRHEMSPVSRYVVTAITVPLMSRYGYSVSVRHTR